MQVISMLEFVSLKYRMKNLPDVSDGDDTDDGDDDGGNESVISGPGFCDECFG